MMIVTLQTTQTLVPVMSVHGDIVKLDLGALLIEVDKEGFKEIMSNIFHQAREHQIFIPLVIGEGRRTAKDA